LINNSDKISFITKAEKESFSAFVVIKVFLGY